jgi:5-(carboxyamino)imidazole ribonucleotide synthase
MAEPLPQGAAIGILGGGQLGRMLAVAAARLGYRAHIYEPGADCPAGQVAWRTTRGAYDDADALAGFAASVGVITYEFENVPSATLDALGSDVPVRPGRRALATSQDRLAEKDFLAGLGLAVAPYAAAESLADLRAALAAIGTPAILKTRRYGYDGKGQIRIANAEEAEAAFAALKGAPAVLEGFVRFEREISVIAARGLSGEVSAYDPGENVHEGGILRETRVPAAIAARIKADAVLTAGRILNSLDYVGVIGIEFFVTDQGLVVNEFAPRVHNSGHWTQNGCAIDQFEQHIRAIAGWPLGDGARYADLRMVNLIGSDMKALPDIARDPTASLHLYGKAEAREGRKMGHVNYASPRCADSG